MKIYRKNWEQQINADLETVWDFFSRPENLNALTPDDMSFEIISPIQGKAMYENMLVEYKVKPIANISMHWLTEITKIKDKSYFIDEQRFGPYALWHHEHHFYPNDQGVLMIDQLEYAIGKGIFGTIAHRLFVGKRIDEIFEFRNQEVEKLFNS